MARTFKRFQTTRDKQHDRKHHIWHDLDGKWWKCVLCGGLTQQPPDYPTPDEWLPDRYEEVTREERNLAPYKPGA